MGNKLGLIRDFILSLACAFLFVSPIASTASAETTSPVQAAAGASPGNEANPDAQAAPETTSGATSAADPTEGSTIKANAPINKSFNDTSGITDVRIRADAGSMSRYSAKFSFSYYGPPVGDISNPKQPNPDGSIGNYNTAIGGSIGLRYRVDPTRTISFGTGLNANTPFRELKRIDVRSPYVSFDKTYRFGAWQMRHSPGLTAITVPEYLAVGEFASASYDLAIYRAIGTSRFTAGIDSSIGYFLYDRDYVANDKTAARYNWGIFPTLKFRGSDQFSAYTSIALNYYNPRKSESQLDVLSRTISQRLGVEYAFNRDVYFAPYLNFYPQSLSIESTTINFNTVFSIL